MGARDMLRVFVLTKIQHAVESKNWSELRIMYGFLTTFSPDEADKIYDGLPEEAQGQLLNYQKKK